MGLIFLLITVFSCIYSLNSIKSKTVGDGQHGTACFTSKNEIRKTYKEIPFEVELWRQGKNLPEIQGTLVGQKTVGKQTKALIDDGDVHTLMIGAALSFCNGHLAQGSTGCQQNRSNGKQFCR